MQERDAAHVGAAATAEEGHGKRSGARYRQAVIAAMPVHRGRRRRPRLLKNSAVRIGSVQQICRTRRKTVAAAPTEQIRRHRDTLTGERRSPWPRCRMAVLSCAACAVERERLRSSRGHSGANRKRLRCLG